MSKIRISDEVTVEDYSAEVIRAIEKKAVAVLHETAGELVSQTKRNTPVGQVNGSHLKKSWDYVVDSSKLEATIGSPLENAIWNEFGTGEYALEDKGRKGGWWIKVGGGKGEMSPSVAKAYKWKKVRKDKNGNITFVFTTGKAPKRSFYNAYMTKKSKIQSMIKKKLGEIK